MKFKYLVSYSTLEDQNKLEEFLFEKTGIRYHFGPINYNGKLSIIAITGDLMHATHTNVTCAAACSFIKFKNIDNFVKSFN